MSLWVPNSLSFIRIPLAFFFILESPYLRLITLLLAMFIDSFDRYLAKEAYFGRRFGVVLDPITDKFFIYFTLFILFLEGRLLLWEMIAMLSRDICVCLYGLWVLARYRFNNVVIRKIGWGKAVTGLQFAFIFILIFDLPIFWHSYLFFSLHGIYALLEIFRLPKRMVPI